MATEDFDNSFAVHELIVKDGSSDKRQPPSTVDLRNNSKSRFMPSSLTADISKCAEISLNKLDFSSVRLYGRDDEVEEIMRCYQSVVQSKSPKEIVLISGYTGSGKSAIVKKFRKECTKIANGEDKSSVPFFASGKFNLNQRVEPYTAFVSAFIELCASITSLGEKSDDFSTIRNNVCEALGAEAPILYDLIPDLKPLLGRHTDEETQKVSIDKKRNRFNYIIRQFARAVCSPKHPVIFYLDDLQWADLASLELIENLATDAEIKGLIIIGCYRENEVNDTHPLLVTLKEIESNNRKRDSQDNFNKSTRSLTSTTSTRTHTSTTRTDKMKKLSLDSKVAAASAHSNEKTRFTRITVGSLSHLIVNEIIADLLHMDVAETKTLASILYEKTQGNIFFVFQCLTFLVDEDLLEYTFGKMCWEWDNDQVRVKVKVSDNVADMVRTKLATKLPSNVTEVLTMASCLGASFDVKTLITIAENISADKTKLKQTEKASAVKKYLDFSVEEGLLIANTNKKSYSFAHDQIQLAAWSLIPPEEQNLFYLKIGEILVDQLEPDELEENIFIAVDLLNSGSELIIEDERRIQLTHLNSQAAKKAMECSAFDSAALYLESGIELLGSNGWSKYPYLNLSLHTSAIEANYCTANFVRLNELADAVLEQKSVSYQDKIVIHCHVILSLGSQAKLQDAIKLTLHVLAQLGAKFPKKWGKLGVLGELVKTKRLLKSHPVDSLLDLPQMKDPLKSKAMRLMDSACTYAFAVDTNLWILLNFKMLQWTLKYGLSKYSSTPFAVYGFVMIGLLGDTKGGEQIGNVALELTHRPSGLETRSAVIRRVAMFVEPWTKPFHVTRQHLIDGYRTGLQTGDLENAMLNILTYCSLCFYSGNPLTQVCDDIEMYSAQMHSFNQTLLEKVLSTIHQLVLNLMGYSIDPLVLTGSAMNQEEMLKNSEESGNAHIADSVQSNRLELAYRFCEYDLLPELIGKVKSSAKTNPFGITIQRNALIEGLSAFALVREGTQTRKWRNHANRIVDKVRGWIDDGATNCTHMLPLFEAERLEIAGDIDAAKKNYDLAVSKARRVGLRHDMALAMERCGEMFFKSGDTFWADHYLGGALNHYIEWGALAKARHLYKKHRSHLSGNFTDSLKEKGEAIENDLRSSGFESMTLRKPIENNLRSSDFESMALRKASAELSN